MKNEKGYILALSLIMMMVLTIVGLASIQAAIHETIIAGNLLLQKQAFQASESGWEITRTKLEALDTDPTSTTWTATETSDGPIRFRAVATHVLNINKDGKQTVKTSAGKPIYRIQSHGYEKESHQITEVVVALRPSLDIPAALYTHTDPLINSDKATVSGMDQCGSNSKYGIVTTGNLVTIKNGTVEGFPDDMETNSGIKIDIPEFIDALKGSANYTNPPQNDGSSPKFLWGKVTSSIPVTPKNPDLPPKVVYYECDVKLTATQGTGILLVKGDLELSGGFAWYGLVVASGSIKFTGNGDMNITGGVFSGNDATIDSTVLNGGVKIFYCSTIKEYLENRIPSTKVLSWREVF